MTNNINRPGGAIGMKSPALPSHASMVSQLEAGMSVTHPQARVKKAGIDVMTIKFLIKELTVEAAKDKEPEDYLLDLAMRLGFWTDGRWDAGEEETHIV